MEIYLSSLPFSYAVNVPQLVAGQVFTGFFTIQADSHFIARRRVVKRGGGSQADAAQSLPDVTVEITDTASGRAYMREPVKLANIFGRGFFPYNIPLGGKIFYKAQVIQVKIENGPDVSPAMQLVWQGEKIFTTSE